MDFDDLNEQDGTDQFGAEDVFLFGGASKEEQDLREQKDSVIFLIDCHDSMFAPNQNNDDLSSSVDAVLAACYSFMKSKIISADGDKIGVVLYGCSQTDNQVNSKCIAVVQQLDVQDAQTIREFQVKIETFKADFHSPTSQATLYDALWVCHQEFKSVEKQNYSKRIFLFTDNENPANSDLYRKAAQQRAKDLEELQVDIELFPMPKPEPSINPESQNGGPQFDIRKFYADIITFDEDEMGQADQLIGIGGAQSRIFELMRRIKQKEFRKRAQGKCLFSLSPLSQMALSFYSTVMPAKKPTATRVNAETGTQLRSTQRFVCKETGSVLYKQQIGTYYPVGNEKVKMTPEEVGQIKKFDKVGMTLMGFKPRSYLKVYHNVKHSTFVYPDERRVTGSSQCMDALVREMKRKDKIAIVRVQVRENAQVRFCALLPNLPSSDKIDEPTGFQLIVLPYADDIRDLDAIMEAAGIKKPEATQPIVETLTKQEKDSAKLLIKNLTIDFASTNFENPTVQRFYSGLQSLALNEKHAEPVQDLLEPDYDGLKQFKPVFDKFKSAFFDGQKEDPESGPQPRQAKTPTAGGRGRARPGALVQEVINLDDVPMETNNEESKEPLNRKRRPDQSLDNDPTKRRRIDEDLIQKPLEKTMATAFYNDTISKQSVASLKEFLISKNRLAAGTTRKPELVKMVGEYFVEKGQ